MMERIRVFREVTLLTPVDQRGQEHPVVVFRVSENTRIGR